MTFVKCAGVGENFEIECAGAAAGAEVTDLAAHYRPNARFSINGIAVSRQVDMTIAG